MFKNESAMIDDFIKVLPRFLREYGLKSYNKLYREKHITPFFFMGKNPPNAFRIMRQYPKADLVISHNSKEITLFEFKNKTTINEVSAGIGQLLIYEYYFKNYYNDIIVNKVLIAPELPDILMGIVEFYEKNFYLIEWNLEYSKLGILKKHEQGQKN